MSLFWARDKPGSRRVELMGGPRDGELVAMQFTENSSVGVTHAVAGTETTGTYLPREGHPFRLFWEKDDGAQKKD